MLHELMSSTSGDTSTAAADPVNLPHQFATSMRAINARHQCAPSMRAINARRAPLQPQ
jgi:hypothetical protein